jgi:signal transduction histidine kinase/chemotaxis methyl-accepting protein methylase/chemotaxis response regulator CheB
MQLESKPRGAGESRADGFPIVAVGASARGLDAVVELLGHVPRDTGMAFVIVLRPEGHETSSLTQVVARATRLPVLPIRWEAPIEPDHVYVIPANLGVTVAGRTFTLSTRPPDARASRLPVDRLFEALATEWRHQAIGVLLAGEGNDGGAGLGAIRRENGLTFAQDPRTTRLADMPGAAIEAGVVDRVLPIPAIGMELLRLGAHPFVRRPLVELSATASKAAELAFVLARLRALSGVDFGAYERAGVEQRVSRRMALRRGSTLAEYEALLRDDAVEAKALCRDLLDHAPSCFHDHATLDELRRGVFPELLKRRRDGGPIRIWAAGCGGGEEPYAIVMTLLECLDDAGAASVPVQLFGSDVSERAIAKARAGIYTADELRGVSEARLTRFFAPVDGGRYRIEPSVRGRCTFMRHDLTRDPPFSRVDLVSCRNVLVYFGAAVRERALSRFHYALNDPGFLVVGRDESVTHAAPLFGAPSAPSAPAGSAEAPGFDATGCVATRRPIKASSLAAAARLAMPSTRRSPTTREPPPAGETARGVHDEDDDAHRIAALTRELEATKECLRAVMWEQQRSHEGLGTVNEELLARNEELLALNDELERTRDAQATTNEELRALSEELRARNEHAEDVNRRKDLFLATLSHELRTPLTGLLLQTQLLRRGRLDAERVLRAAASIEKAAHAQARLIDDLLDVSRIVTGKLRLEFQSVALGSIVQAAVDTVEPAAERRKITIERQIDPALASVAGDPARLQQVVLNLLTNAIKFSPDGGLVRVLLDVSQGHGRIRVSDDGIGIAPGFLPDIFERFSQEDRGVTRTRGGLGLGLAIVRYIVEAHGGSVVAESAGVGTGSTFTVQLPLIPRPDELIGAVAVASTDGAGGRRLERLRVLVVEDDPGTRDALTEMLGNCGAEVRSVDSAEHAMTTFDEFAPDVLVSDVAMPDEDGYHLLARIRARGAEHGGDVPAIALTGLATRDDSQRAIAAGFQLHLAKPVDTDRLIAALSAIAKRAGHERRPAESTRN